jgi:putative ABC transport system permease protein
VTPFFLILALPIVAVILHDIARRPVLRRVAFRNLVRRRGEAGLVILGSLLGTAIITASFIVGDTLGSSIRDFARTELGPVDVIARTNDLAKLPAMQQALAVPPAETDGVLAVVTSNAAIASAGRDPRAEPHASFGEMDFDAARRFGGNPKITGMAGAGPTPTGDQVVINKSLAHTLEVGKGDAVEIYSFGAKHTFRVREVLPKVGLAGFSSAYVAPGTIARLFAETGGGGTSPPSGVVAVSNTGGVFDSASRSATVTQEVKARVQAIGGVSVDDVKQRLLDQADRGAKSFTSLFGAIGAFGVIAGILLLINIFVMLAEERKSELGMLRAVGLKRNQLVRAFGMEGGIYSVVAAMAGAMAGIGVGRAIVVVASSLINSGESEANQLHLAFRASPQSLIGGVILGGSIGLITVWLSSLRLGRLNIIHAIRDITEPPLRRQRRWTLVLSAVGMVAGVLLFLTGAAAGQGGWFGAMVGLPVAAYASIPLLTRFLPRRLVVTAACLVGLIWPVACFSILPEVFKDIDIPAFVVQGVLLVSAAVAGGATNADIAGRYIERGVAVSGGLASRLGFAYPLARKFRTSMLLAIYALVVFTMTFLATFSNMFANQAPRFVRENRAGFDLVIDSNQGNPVRTETLQAQPEVTATAALVQAYPKFSSPIHKDYDFWGMTGFDSSFIRRGVPTLGSRATRYSSDRAAWAAVAANPNLMIVSDFFEQEGGGPPSARLKPGETVTAENPTTGVRQKFELVGVLDNDFVDVGAVVSIDAARALMGPEAVVSRFYAAVKPGLDPAKVATRLTGRLLANGVETKSIDKAVNDGLSQNQGFFRLMEGYLVLGLLIGVAGLGVVMVRAVRERRRQIGMLRAMGFPTGVVRRAFLIESTFVATQGILVGIVLALVVSYQLLVNSNTFGDTAVAFEVPWGSLILLFVIALGGSLLATFAPANQASKIKPAVALRIAD